MCNTGNKHLNQAHIALTLNLFPRHNDDNQKLFGVQCHVYISHLIYIPQ